MTPPKPPAFWPVLSGSRPETLSDSGSDRPLVRILDQRFLPHKTVLVPLRSWRDAERAIALMQVRGAPLIGVTGAYGVYLAARGAPAASFDVFVRAAAKRIVRARPTAVNLAYGVNRVLEAMRSGHGAAPKIRLALSEARRVADEDRRACKKIGENGLVILRRLYQKLRRPVRILTHCNAGRLAALEWGTATAPIYHAHKARIPLTVWVDETRPRNQGASLTAWELGRAGVPHRLIADNAGGHLMQRGEVDLVIVGADRVSSRGDAANKIGTYLKALAAREHGVPFYVALPFSTFDFGIRDGLAEIPIEERPEREVTHLWGRSGGAIVEVALTAPGTRAQNPAFDVTPAELVTGFITERGIFNPRTRAFKKLSSSSVRP